MYILTKLCLYITANEAVPGCSIKNLKEDDMHKDEGFERLLMCNLFHECYCGLPILKQTSLSATKRYEPYYLNIMVLCYVVITLVKSLLDYNIIIAWY